MLKAIFSILTDPLPLPLDWYYEYIILAVIGLIAYLVAYSKVGDLYHNGFISDGLAGSVLHWIIRFLIFIALWVITYAIIIVGQIIIENWQISLIIAGCAVCIAIISAIIIYSTRRKL